MSLQPSVYSTPLSLSLKDQILHSLRQEILRGDLRPGERLLEVPLAQRLGSSRAPVREALRLLEMEGLIETSAYRETRVTRVNPQELEEVLLPIRITLEGFALRAWLPERRNRLLEQLAPVVEQMMNEAERSDAPEMAMLDLAFHRTLVDVDEHPHLKHVWLTIAPTMMRVFALNTTTLTPVEVALEHRALLDVFAEADCDQSESALSAHIRAMVEDFLRTGLGNIGLASTGLERPVQR